MQLTRAWLSGDKNLFPWTGERHLLHSLVFLFASTGQEFKLSNNNYRVTEWTVCTWVTSKLTHWYVHTVCCIASYAKGYQALPLLTVCRRCAGEETGKKAKLHLLVLHNILTRPNVLQTLLMNIWIGEFCIRSTFGWNVTMAMHCTTAAWWAWPLVANHWSHNCGHAGVLILDKGGIPITDGICTSGGAVVQRSTCSCYAIA